MSDAYKEGGFIEHTGVGWAGEWGGWVCDFLAIVDGHSEFG